MARISLKQLAVRLQGAGAMSLSFEKSSQTTQRLMPGRIVESLGAYPELLPAGKACPRGFNQCDPAAADACVAPQVGTASGASDPPTEPVCAVDCLAGGTCISGCNCGSDSWAPG